MTSSPSSINFDSPSSINNFNTLQCNNKSISLQQCKIENQQQNQLLQQQQQQQKQQQQQQQQQQQITFTRTPSRTSWSHISTPESLEWDIDEEQQKQLRVEDDNLDHETLELLHEIELLKNKVLNETGSGLIDDKFEMNWKNDSS
ncbi:probable serine/threonine-protein kinase dyrk1 [Condylostylus longicornis]|uniref:probable serine/threonine-protein kinase dyrk1 n=1 Tax=Condylostylus longicornis TaxID=2530218 RepID=UPI00244DB985|nr:probable serine/threonine-protein kinase dyrk1 [Condylostylus longicornis]